MSKATYRPIADIRLYQSDIENIDGNSLPNAFAPKALNIVITRITMKLREKSFSLGDFDHLYVNFTTCLERGLILPAKRSIDIYHKWYRYYDVGVSKEEYRMLTTERAIDFIVERVKQLLKTYFNFDGNCSVEACIDEVIHRGEDMLMLYKSKQTSTRKANICLQLLDNGTYCPNLFVYDQNEKLILHQKLPCTLDLMSLGEIQLSNQKVVVKPRKNSLALNLEPIIFELR